MDTSLVAEWATQVKQLLTVLTYSAYLQCLLTCLLRCSLDGAVGWTEGIIEISLERTEKKITERDRVRFYNAPGAYFQAKSKFVRGSVEGGGLGLASITAFVFDNYNACTTAL